jgi:hypothetical protein
MHLYLAPRDAVVFSDERADYVLFSPANAAWLNRNGFALFAWFSRKGLKRFALARFGQGLLRAAARR